MAISKRAQYALRIMIRLGIVQRTINRPMSVSTLASQEHLSAKYTEAILFDLRHAGYLETVLGKYGGIQITKNLEAINLDELVNFYNERDWFEKELAAIAPCSAVQCSAVQCSAVQ